MQDLRNKTELWLRTYIQLPLDRPLRHRESGTRSNGILHECLQNNRDQIERIQKQNFWIAAVEAIESAFCLTKNLITTRLN